VQARIAEIVSGFNDCLQGIVFYPVSVNSKILTSEITMNSTKVDFSAREVVGALRRTFPQIQGIKMEDEDKIFLGNAAEGGEINGLPACDYYNEDYEETVYVMGVHRKLHTLLDTLGWFVEPHDPGTYYAYRG